MKKSAVFLALVVVIAAVIPFFLGNFTLRTATDILIFAILASSWNIIGGLTGYASFGQIVFFGVGAYATAIFMNNFGLPFIPAMIASGLVSAAYGFLIGLPILRLKGHYFAIATLGLAEATKALVQNLEVTEGNAGMYLPIPDLSIDASYLFYYYTALGVLLITLLVTYFLLKSKLGYGMIAIREDEDAADSIGVNTTLFKSTAFGLSGLFRRHGRRHLRLPAGFHQARSGIRRNQDRADDRHGHLRRRRQPAGADHRRGGHRGHFQFSLGTFSDHSHHLLRFHRHPGDPVHAQGDL